MQEPDAVRLPITCVAIFIILPLILYAVPQRILQKLGGAQVHRARTDRGSNVEDQAAGTARQAVAVGSNYHRVPQEEENSSPADKRG